MFESKTSRDGGLAIYAMATQIIAARIIAGVQLDAGNNAAVKAAIDEMANTLAINSLEDLSAYANRQLYD